MEFLGIKIDNVTLEEAQLKVRDFLVLPGQFKIFTPNPEMVIKAHSDEFFRKTLNSGDLNICDGFGLWLALSSRHHNVILSKAKNLHWGRFFPANLRVRMTPQRITGGDFMLEICQIAEATGKSIFLMGTRNKQILLKAKENLQKKFPKLNIVGFDTGPIIFNCHPGPQIGGEGSLSVVSKINQSGADILFVAFGMGKQEQWINENLTKLPSIKIAMGVGGALDYISGTVPRAPLFLRKIGLEWLYRLIRQPQRLGRIFNATFKFILLNLSNFKKS